MLLNDTRGTFWEKPEILGEGYPLQSIFYFSAPFTFSTLTYVLGKYRNKEKQ